MIGTFTIGECYMQLQRIEEISTLRTVSLGQRWSVEDLCEAVKAGGISISPYAKVMMQEPDFVTALDIDPEQEFDLAAVPVEYVAGRDRGTKPMHAIAAFMEMGFHICPLWTVFMLGLDGIQERMVVAGNLVQGRLFGIGPKGIFGDLPDWLWAQDRVVLVKPCQTQQAMTRTSVVQVKQGSLARWLLRRKK